MSIFRRSEKEPEEQIPEVKVDGDDATITTEEDGKPKVKRVKLAKTKWA